MNKRDLYPKNFIKELREKRGWTLRDLEEKTRWSHQTVSNLELSKSDLTWSKMQKLAEVFDCHPLEITDGPEGIAPKNTREKELLERFRGFSEGEKSMYLHMLKSFDKEKGKADEEDHPHPHKTKA